MKVLQWENYYFKWLSNKIERLCNLIDPIFQQHYSSSNTARITLPYQSKSRSGKASKQTSKMGRANQFQGRLTNYSRPRDGRHPDPDWWIPCKNANQSICKSLEARLPTNQSKYKSKTREPLLLTIRVKLSFVPEGNGAFEF